MELEQILDSYRNGDENKRLNLFLGYRELRDEFSRIEQDISDAQSLKKMGGPKWLRWKAGYL